MYSLLLMTALSAGPDTASFGGRMFAGHSCCGGYAVSCYGCCGYSYGCCGYSYGCCGYSYGCCGYSYGCCGGGGLFHHKQSYSYGCCGYSYGCCGGYYPGYASCCGGCGGAWAGSCYGSAYGGCYGSWYGSSYGQSYGSGCFGYGITVGGPVVVGPGVVTMPPAATIVPATPPAATPDPKDGKSSSTTVEKPASSAARLTIELPATAKLIVDGKPTRGDGPTRQFHTPALPAGQAFFYEMRAEMEIDGKVEVEEKRVVVRAGEALTESFAKLAAAAAGVNPTAVAAAK